MIPTPHRRLLGEVVELLVPGTTAARTLDWLDEQAEEHHAELWSTVLGPGLEELSEHCERHRVRPDADLVRAWAGQDGDAGPRARFVRELTDIAAHHHYGRDNSPAWDEMGYQAGPKRPASVPVVQVTPRQHGFADLGEDGNGAAGGEGWDAVVIGAGAGGGTAALELASAGARVLLLDRGRYLTYRQVGRDHLANHRFSRYGHNTGPESRGNPRVAVDRDGTERTVARPHLGPWQNNAMTVGGGTRVYQGMAWRFQPEDFAMASRHGVPEGSSLADWPLTYEELEPHYTRAERELGVCGDGSSHRVQGRRTAGYPMPPLPDNREAEVLRAGAKALGLSTGPVPLLLNSVPRDGRAECVQCGECVGFACPVDAKNGTHNTVIPRALATGRCTLVTGVRAERVRVDASGRATGVDVVDQETGARRTVRAGAVVVAAGAIETARLLLASACEAFPEGLGNRSDQVGRHLQGHLYVGAFGLFDEELMDSAGPGVTIATADYAVPPVGGGHPVGGGVLANDCIKLPLMFREWALPPDAERWGEEGRRAMTEGYRRTSHVMGPIQEVPSGGNRVTLAAGVTDRHGAPVARLSGALHPESVRAGEAHRERAVEWMRASGARRVWPSGTIGGGLSGGQHQAGTARMGADPATSVTDPHGRVHGHPGLWVTDASLHVTNGGVNPVLTVYALAFRVAAEFVRASGR